MIGCVNLIIRIDVIDKIEGVMVTSNVVKLGVRLLAKYSLIECNHDTEENFYITDKRFFR